jgi:hypothetical protein
MDVLLMPNRRRQIATFLLAGLLAGLPTSGGAAGQGAVRVMLVDLYAGDAATLACGDRVLAVPHPVLEGVDPLQAAVDALLQPDNGPARRAGLYNALASSELTVEELSVHRGTATLRLLGELRTVDSCDPARIRGQLNATLLQFRGIVNTAITINGARLEVLLPEQQ